MIWSAHGNHTTHITNLTQSMYITQTLNKLKIVVSLPLVALIVYPFLRPLMNISGFSVLPYASFYNTGFGPSEVYLYFFELDPSTVY